MREAGGGWCYTDGCAYFWSRRMVRVRMVTMRPLRSVMQIIIRRGIVVIVFLMKSK